MHKLLLRRDQDLQKIVKNSREMEDVTAKLQREVFSFPGFSAKKNRIVRNSREMADVTAKLSATCFHFPDFQQKIVSSKTREIADVTAKLKHDVFSFPGFSAKQFWCTECN